MNQILLLLLLQNVIIAAVALSVQRRVYVSHGARLTPARQGLAQMGLHMAASKE